VLDAVGERRLGDLARVVAEISERCPATVVAEPGTVDGQFFARFSVGIPGERTVMSAERLRTQRTAYGRSTTYDDNVGVAHRS
jgi:hypothetical protein